MSIVGMIKIKILQLNFSDTDHSMIDAKLEPTEFDLQESSHIFSWDFILIPRMYYEW